MAGRRGDDEDDDRPARRREDGGYDDRPACRRGFECPYCGSAEPPLVRSEISTGGWIVFAVMLVTCFPLFWVGFFIKDEYRQCDECGVRLG